MARRTTIDLITTATDGTYILGLVEEGPWGRKRAETQLRRIQQRLYDAIDVAIDGHLAARYPESRGRAVVIRLTCYDTPDEPVREFFDAFVTHARTDPEIQHALQAGGWVKSLDFKYLRDSLKPDSTREWAKSLGISTALNPRPVADYTRRYGRTAQQVATRALILQGVVAVTAGVAPEPVVNWFRSQRLWRAVTPEERTFLAGPSRSKTLRARLAAHQEAEWTLLWMVGKVAALGLPDHGCDTRRLADRIVPALGADVEPFLASAVLRQPAALLAEDDRTYNLWCLAQEARRRDRLPNDFCWEVLYERRYAFEWLDGTEAWDNVTCDA